MNSLRIHNPAPTGAGLFDRWLCIFVGILLCLLSACSHYSEDDLSPISEIAEKSSPTFFIPIHVAQFSFDKAPCVDVRFENATFLMKLDLGLGCDLSINDTLIGQISAKKFSHMESIFGFTGKEYLHHVYRVPKVEIGSMSFINPTLHKDSQELRKEAVIMKDGQPAPAREPGRIGWKLFYNTNLLLDLSNQSIAFCDSFDTLVTKGYRSDDFIRTPLLQEHGVIEFLAATSQGPMRCVLDTGTTWNIFNAELPIGKSIEQMIWDPENILEYGSFKIDHYDFGSITFRCLPIHTPVPVEAILGMEFFLNHVVFIDFSEKQIYVSKSPASQKND